MTVEMRDGLTAVAVLLSVASFGVALWNARFTRRAKNVELRASLLARMSEARLVVSKFHDRVSSLRRIGRVDVNAHLPDALRYECLSKALQQLEETHVQLKSLQSSHGLVAYEAIFHELQTPRRSSGRCGQSREFTCSRERGEQWHPSAPCLTIRSSGPLRRPAVLSCGGRQRPLNSSVRAHATGARAI